MVVVIAVVVGLCVLWFGIKILRALGAPRPEPLPAGEMRKVNLRFACQICGTTVRMTAAPDEEPEPPRHCLEDMVLVAPTFE